MTSFLLARSGEMSQELARKINAISGCCALELDLINYQRKDILLDSQLYYRVIAKYAFIIVTSYFCAQNLPHALNQKIMVLVVGEKSAKILLEKGYKVQFISSNAEQLKEEIIARKIESAIYLSSNNISCELPKNITRYIAYDVIYLSELSTEQIMQYRKGIDYIIIYSAKSMEVFLNLFRASNLLDMMQEKCILIAISQKVADIAKGFFLNIIISPEPHLIAQEVLKLCISNQK